MKTSINQTLTDKSALYPHANSETEHNTSVTKVSESFGFIALISLLIAHISRIWPKVAQIFLLVTILCMTTALFTFLLIRALDIEHEAQVQTMADYKEYLKKPAAYDTTDKE